MTQKNTRGFSEIKAKTLKLFQNVTIHYSAGNSNLITKNYL